MATSTHAHTRSRGALLLLAAMVGGAATLSGCAVWKLGTSARMVEHSTPFESQPAAPTGSLLVVGDSTAEGTGASSPSRSVPGLLAAQNPGLRVVNKASAGARYEDFAAQLQSAQGQFDTVLVLGGGNDVIRLTRQDELRAAVRRTVALARERGARVVLMPPGNVGNAPFFLWPLARWMDHRSQQLHAIVREEAQRGGAHYVNLYQDKAHDPFAQRPRHFHAADGLHPSDAGYALWLQELQRQL